MRDHFAGAICALCAALCLLDLVPGLAADFAGGGGRITPTYCPPRFPATAHAFPADSRVVPSGGERPGGHPSASGPIRSDGIGDGAGSASERDHARNPRLVPIQYREPGPIKSVVSRAVGLVTAVTAAPFQLAEQFVPLPSPIATPRNVACGPVTCAAPPVPPGPACVGPRAVTCPHIEPTIAPLPPVACAPSCAPKLPPSALKEHEYPPLEGSNLLAGVLLLPVRLLETGRVLGDLLPPADRSQSPQ
jgi:hypothetical protein